MCSEYMDEARLERLFYRLYAKTVEKTHQFWNMLVDSGSSQRLMIFKFNTFSLTLTTFSFLKLLNILNIN